MINVVPFKPEHIIHMDFLECFDKEPRLIETVLSLREAPELYRRTLLSVRGEVVAVFGGFATYRCMTIWAAIDKIVRKYPIAYHKTMKLEIERIMKEWDLLRMQSFVFCDNDKAIEQHIYWGFNVEARMRKSGPQGEDQYLFAKVV